MAIRLALRAAVLGLSVGLAGAQALAAETVLDVPVGSETRQVALLVEPAHAPKAAIVMLPGGSGEIGIAPDGSLRHRANFTVRTRALWTARGYAVLIPDAPDGRNLRGSRASPGYAAVVAALVRVARERTGAPVFLLGTSQGAIAAVSGAAHASPGTVAGLILTESVSVRGGSGETVFDANPQAVRVPALIIANRDDQCRVAPPDNARRIAAALSGSPDVRVLTVSGGEDRSGNPCGSLSPHGYLGMEDEVVDAVAAWMEAHRPGP